MIAPTETAILARLAEERPRPDETPFQQASDDHNQSALSRARTATIDWPGLEDEAQ